MWSSKYGVEEFIKVETLTDKTFQLKFSIGWITVPVLCGNEEQKC